MTSVKNSAFVGNIKLVNQNRQLTPDQDLIMSEDTILLQITQSQCQHCQEFEKEKPEIFKSIGHDVKILQFYYDQHDNNQLFNKLIAGIPLLSPDMGTPTFILIDKGEFVAKKGGAMPKDDLIKWINANKSGEPIDIYKNELEEIPPVQLMYRVTTSEKALIVYAFNSQNPEHAGIEKEILRIKQKNPYFEFAKLDMSKSFSEVANEFYDNPSADNKNTPALLLFSQGKDIATRQETIADGSSERWIYENLTAHIDSTKTKGKQPHPS